MSFKTGVFARAIKGGGGGSCICTKSSSPARRSVREPPQPEYSQVYALVFILLDNISRDVIGLFPIIT